MIGGARRPQLVDEDDQSLIRMAIEELREIAGITASPTVRELVRWKRAIPQYNVGHEDRLKRIEAILGKFPGLYLTGNAYRGVGMNDCVRRAEELVRELAP